MSDQPTSEGIEPVLVAATGHAGGYHMLCGLQSPHGPHDVAALVYIVDGVEHAVRCKGREYGREYGS